LTQEKKQKKVKAAGPPAKPAWYLTKQLILYHF